MIAIVLVGGEGTRLLPLTSNTTKAMVPVLNRPFLEYVILRLKSYGIREIVLTSGYKPHGIREYFGDGHKFDVHLTYIVEDFPLGTAGAVKNAEQHIKDSFLVINGDVLTDLDISSLIRFHQREQAAVTIALTPVQDPSLYGVVEVALGGKILRFIEKPPKDTISSNMINAGVYVVEPCILKYIPNNEFYMFERQVFPQLLKDSVTFTGFTFSGYWIDIGSPEKYRQLNHDLLLGKSRQIQNCEPDRVIIGKETFVHQEAIIRAPVLIGEGCVISKGVSITGPTVIGHDCKIEEYSSVDSAVLWNRVEIGRRAAIGKCVIGNGCRLRDGCRVEDDSALGDGVTVAPGAVVNRGSRVEPENRFNAP